VEELPETLSLEALWEEVAQPLPGHKRPLPPMLLRQARAVLTRQQWTLIPVTPTDPRTVIRKA